MMPTVFHALGTAAMPLAAAGNAPGTLLPAVLLLCIVVLVVGGLRFRTLRAAHAEQTRLLGEQSIAARTGAEQLQKMRAELDEKQREVQTLRQESGVQRKKNHTLQDEIKRVRNALKEETERRVAAQNTRPAFAEPSPKVVVAREAEKPVREAEPRPAPAPVAPLAPAPSELALQAQIKTLEAALGEQKQSISEERVAVARVKDELKKLRKRSEDLRRIDIITKSKMEILEDKLRHLGREHYEAISEVALLKGQVRPPRPREDVRQTSMFEAPESAEVAAGVEMPEPEHDRVEALAIPSDDAPDAPDEDAAGDTFDATVRHDAPSVVHQASLL